MRRVSAGSWDVCPPDCEAVGVHRGGCELVLQPGHGQAVIAASPQAESPTPGKMVPSAPPRNSPNAGCLRGDVSAAPGRDQEDLYGLSVLLVRRTQSRRVAHTWQRAQTVCLALQQRAIRETVATVLA